MIYKMGANRNPKSNHMIATIIEMWVSGESLVSISDHFGICASESSKAVQKYLGKPKTENTEIRIFKSKV